MTREERNNKLKHFITCLKCEVSGKHCDVNCSTQYDAGNMGEIIENLEAISKYLEQEPFINKLCVSSGVCEHDKNKVLDKIRAEIIMYEGDCRLSVDEYPSCKQCTDNVFGTIYGILDKYKPETEKT